MNTHLIYMFVDTSPNHSLHVSQTHRFTGLPMNARPTGLSFVFSSNFVPTLDSRGGHEIYIFLSRKEKRREVPGLFWKTNCAKEAAVKLVMQETKAQ